MRKMITALAALLLAVTSAQGGYTLSFEDHATGYNWPSDVVCTVDLMLTSDGQPSATFGDTAYLGAQGVLAPLPAGWSVSNLVYNTVDFDSELIVPGSSPTGLMGIAADLNAIGGVGYTSKKTLLSFTLVAPTFGQMALDPAQTSVVDSQFNAVYVGAGDLVTIPFGFPEPATALLLIAALPLLRRRRA